MIEIFIQNRKRILQVLFGFIFIWFIYYAFTHSLVTIVGVGPDTKAVSLNRGLGTKPGKGLSLNSNSKTLILPKGDYSIEVKSDNKISYYQRKFSGLSRSKIAVEVQSQKKSISIGTSRLKCAADKPEKHTTFFYFCNPGKSGYFEVSTGTEVKPYSTSIFPSQAEHGEKGQDLEEKASGKSSTIKTYLSGLLEIGAKDGSLFIKYGDLDDLQKDYPSVEIKDFQGDLNDSIVAVSTDKNSGSFAIFDSNKKSILFFDDFNNNLPHKTDVSKDIGDVPSSSVKLVHSNRFSYLVVSGQTDTSHGPKENQDTNQKAEQSKVLVFNNASKKLEKAQKLEKNFIPGKSTSSPDGTLLIRPVYETSPELLVLSGTKKSSLVLPHKDVQDFCWKNNEGFYYRTLSENQIYFYSLDKRGAFLVYENLPSKINNMNCVFGQLSFTLDSKKDGEINKFVHYALSEKDLLGNPLELAMPLYIDIDFDSIKVSQQRESLKVDLLRDGNKNGTGPPKDLAKQEIEKRLDQKGIETKNLEVIFTY